MTQAVQNIKGLLEMNSDCNLKQVEITPEIATELLKYNTHNRPRQKKREKDYAKDMEEGKFKLQESMISFDNDGVLTNGQTRLHACISANKSFPATVCIGLNQSIHMDTGKTRNMVDNIQLNGAVDEYINANNHSIKTVTALLRFKNYRQRIRGEEVITFCKQYGNIIDSAYDAGLLNLKGSQQYLFKSEIAAAFLVAMMNGADRTELMHIRSVLTSGQSLSKQDEIITHLRDKLLIWGASGHASTNITRKQIYYGTQHVIYTYINKNKTKAIRTDIEYYKLP